MNARPGALGLRLVCGLILLTGCGQGGRDLGFQALSEDVQETADARAGELLGSAHGGHAWFDYCADKPDAAVLPIDPRSLVQPGVSEGRAVHYNVYWQDCHALPKVVNEAAHPQSCGELRASHRKGAELMLGLGHPKAGSFFGANDASGPFEFTAERYNQLWAVWGLPGRPDNFDALVHERLGQPKANVRNPYPLSGEDPNATDGGSGQLPAGFTQLREPDGSWSGRIGMNCHGCHSAQIGLPEEGEGLGLVYGAPNHNGDVSTVARDIALTGAPAISVFALFSTSRGTNNAAFFNIAALASAGPDQDMLDVLTSGSNASGDNAPWWNVGHRPAKFWDGLFVSDAVRVDMAFFTPLGQTGANEWVQEHAPAADHWLLALKSPRWPYPVDENLARAGAILFHNKDLWASHLDNPTPRPAGGNGSCASCHGAYAPLYVNDPAYLADPALEGVASYVVPLDIIGTDPSRALTQNEGVSQALSDSHIGYPELAGTQYDCGTTTRESARQGRDYGYLAPPLYGVWASAPYFHNGSVPDVWGVLSGPEERPALWRRVSTPPRPDQAGQVVMGFDVSLQRAYDAQRLGWRYEVLECGDGSLPVLDCTPGMDDADPVAQIALDALYGNALASWNVGNVDGLLSITPQQIENRKIYNTHKFSQGNAGHAFTQVLNAAERAALVEYLKTL